MYQVVLTSQRGVWTDRDLSEEVVRDQIAVPFLQGEHVFVGQALFHPSTIESLAIYFSEKPLTAVLQELQNLRALSFRGGAFSRSEVLARMGMDVTDRILSEAREFIAANPNEHPAVVETRDKIFLVHGRNIQVRNSLLALLQAMRLRPLQWEGAVNEAKSPSPYVGDVLDAVFDAARAVVVLITGDDEARLRRQLWGPSEPSHERRYNPQARPNVLFEAGMAFAKCSNRTVIASVGYTRPFSDIAGGTMFISIATTVIWSWLTGYACVAAGSNHAHPGSGSAGSRRFDQIRSRWELIVRYSDFIDLLPRRLKTRFESIGAFVDAVVQEREVNTPKVRRLKSDDIGTIKSETSGKAGGLKCVNPGGKCQPSLKPQRDQLCSPAAFWRANRLVSGI